MSVEFLSFLGMSSLTGVHSLWHNSGEHSGTPTISLNSGHHPQTNGQTEQLNQELETELRCPVSKNSAS